jgi:RNA polymerase sigma factor (sigma-70 family)
MKLLSESTQLQGGSAAAADAVGDLAARREERARARTDAIFAAHGDEVERVCRALLRDPTDAEDAKQQTFLSAYRALLGGTEPRDVAAWLATIARHECYRVSAARKQAAIPALELIEQAPDLADVHTQAIANLSAARLRREIRRLPSLQRDAILLREFAGLSYEELARELGVTRPAAHSLLVRARTTLRGRLRTEIAAVNFLAALASLRKLFRHLPWRSGATSLTTKAAVITLAGTAMIGGGFVAEHELTRDGHHHADAASAVPVSPAARGVVSTGTLASLRRTSPAHSPAKRHRARVAARAAAAATDATAHGTSAAGFPRSAAREAPDATHGSPLDTPASSTDLARTEASGVTTDSTASAPEQDAAPSEQAPAAGQAPTVEGGSARSATSSTIVAPPASRPLAGAGSAGGSTAPTPPAHLGGPTAPATGGGTTARPSPAPHAPQTPGTRGGSGKPKHKSPPGQTKKLAGADAAPGQEKKLALTGGVASSPSQASKQAAASSSASNTTTTTRGAQGGQHSIGSASPGQSTAPGQVKKADSASATTTATTPPGQTNRPDSTDTQSKTPPGQAKKPEADATQSTTTATTTPSSAAGAPPSDAPSPAPASTTSSNPTDTSTAVTTTQTQATTTQSPGNGNGNGGNPSGANPTGNNGNGTGNGHGHGP